MPAMQKTTNMTRPQPRRQSARGISIIVALMALVAVSFAAVALVRSVDTSGLIVGNLAFKQDATATAEQASEQAITWIGARVAGTTLHTDSAASGYYATSLDALDVTGRKTANTGRAVVDWAGDACASYASGTYGVCMTPSAEVPLAGDNRARWVITRLCASAGDPASAGVDCSATLGSGASNSPNRGELSYNTGRLSSTTYSQYYRIVVRAQGARGTVAFIETIAHF